MKPLLYVFILLIFESSLYPNHQYEPRKGKLKSTSAFNIFKYSPKKQTHSKNNNQITAFGINSHLYFLNSFLVNYRPFVSKNIFHSHFHLQKHLKTNKKRHRINTLKTSRQTYKSRLAILEEKAITLADWLISLGYNAKVVVGMFKRKKHSWVLLINKNQYILDPSAKTQKKHFPLASTLPNYHPKYMYDREAIWENTGSIYTVNYLDEKWKKTYVFFPNP